MSPAHAELFRQNLRMALELLKKAGAEENRGFARLSLINGALRQIDATLNHPEWPSKLGLPWPALAGYISSLTLSRKDWEANQPSLGKADGVIATSTSRLSHWTDASVIELKEELESSHAALSSYLEAQGEY